MIKRIGTIMWILFKTKYYSHNIVISNFNFISVFKFVLEFKWAAKNVEPHKTDAVAMSYVYCGDSKEQKKMISMSHIIIHGLISDENMFFNSNCIK